MLPDSSKLICNNCLWSYCIILIISPLPYLPWITISPSWKFVFSSFSGSSSLKIGKFSLSIFFVSVSIFIPTFKSLFRFRVFVFSVFFVLIISLKLSTIESFAILDKSNSSSIFCCASISDCSKVSFDLFSWISCSIFSMLLGFVISKLSILSSISDIFSMSSDFVLYSISSMMTLSSSIVSSWFSFVAALKKSSSSSEKLIF